MARLNVNPTRMELSRLKERLALASRGHDLLKDKQDGLMRSFISLVRQTHQVRQEVEASLKKGTQNFALAKALVHEHELEQLALIPAYEEVTVDVHKENMLSVNVPRMFFDQSVLEEDVEMNYGYLGTNSDIDASMQEFAGILPKLLKLAELEKRTLLLGDEIEKTRRRVNALRERTIPDLEETIHYIELKLDENERAEISRLMKIKDFDEADEFLYAVE
ncbi:V-type ATP synthase subunit D [Suicoccus acidiformans]|uniref:V-type ATP synthase subunit D n=1 Tax=Suicoccus acidiformans TaxID=2036206 RepID=A0A347WIX7_9LACT|nr:V-type ATP synthase subunit D [Suicoccus acidiformans]AXY25034.1 V-type ATP synthase subunit D [Suicoccus acidiformans]